MKRILLILSVILLVSCDTKSVDSDGGIIVVADLGNDKHNKIQVIESRLKSMNLEDCKIKDRDDNLFDIEIPDYSDTAIIRELLSKKGKFSVERTYSIREIYPILENNERMILDQNNEINEDSTLFKLLSLVTNSNGDLIDAPVVGCCAKEDTSSVMKLVDKYGKYLPSSLRFKWGVKIGKDVFPLISIKKSEDIPITHNMIAKSYVLQGCNETEYDVNVKLKKEYYSNLEDLTTQNVGLSVAIMIDNTVYIYPKVTSTIGSGKLVLSDRYSYNEGLLIASYLNSGVLDIDINEIKLVSK